MPLPALTRYDADKVLLSEHLSLVGATKSYRTEQVWKGLYRQFVEPTELTVLPEEMRAAMRDDPFFSPALKLVAERTSDGGDTTKLLWRLSDGHAIETVLMFYKKRRTKKIDLSDVLDDESDDESNDESNAIVSDDAPGRVTVCVSTQAGCAMGCGFCATGQAGFERNLTVGEILEQVINAARLAAPRRISNVVFMGMGEPLATEKTVWHAIERLQGDMGLSARRLTVSTVGMVPGIRKLSQRPLPVNLAVSLHAANNELRSKLLPVNRIYPLEALVEACEEWIASKNRRLWFEWALIANTNDRRQDVAELAAIAKPLNAHVNLIPLNPTPGWATVGTSPERVRAFADELLSYGVNVTVRANRGTDIDAACGQLSAARSTETMVEAPKVRRLELTD